MKEKLIVLDLDGTLLRNDGSLSDYSKNVLINFQRKGGIIILASARSLNNMCEIGELINAKYLVANNGSTIVENKKLIYSSSMDQLLVKRLMNKILLIENANVALAYQDRILTNNPDFAGKGGREYSDFRDFCLSGVQKISVFTNNMEAIQTIKNTEPEIVIYTNSNSENYFTIVDYQVSKLNAVMLLCEKENLKMDNIIVFGNDDSDLALIKNSGLGIAVRNSINKVLSVCKYICDTNENDGPAKWIETYMENERYE